MATRTLKVAGRIPADTWNRVGARLIPKLRSGQELELHVLQNPDTRLLFIGLSVFGSLLCTSICV